MREGDFERSNFSESSMLQANIDNRTSFAYAVINDTGLEFVEDDNGGPQRVNNALAQAQQINNTNNQV